MQYSGTGFFAISAALVTFTFFFCAVLPKEIYFDVDSMSFLSFAVPTGMRPLVNVGEDVRLDELRDWLPATEHATAGSKLQPASPAAAALDGVKLPVRLESDLMPWWRWMRRQAERGRSWTSALTCVKFWGTQVATTNMSEFKRVAGKVGEGD